MNKFYNRVGQNLNRKELEVVSIERDASGEITSLVVDENRCDSDIQQEGTALEANVVNTIIRNMILEELSITDLERVTDDKNALSYESSITENIVLPLYGEKGSKISWEVTSGTGLSIEGEVGVVTRADTDQVVTLTATIAFRDCIQTKEFNIKILKLPKYTPESYETSWVRTEEGLCSSNFIVSSTTESPIFCDAGDTGYSVDFSFTKNGTRVVIARLTESTAFNNINGEGSIIINCSIKVYSDSSKTVLLGEIPCIINYKY